MSLLGTLLRYLPTLGKYVLVLILALNAHSLPFVWHVRFWWRLIPRQWIVWTQGQRAYVEKKARLLRASGGVAARSRVRRRAWFDDCDYNMHLSNSCYAKNADYAMSTWMFDNLTGALETGGYSALGGSHYTFIREIPIMSEYYTEARVVGWGDKWYYFVTEFIIYPKKSKSSKARRTIESKTPGSATPASPAPESGAATPPDVAMPGTTTTGGSGSVAAVNDSTTAGSDLASHALAALRSPRARSDGGVVAAIAVHELCMKIGRITVPPRIGLYLAGHSSSPEAQATAHELSLDTKAAKAFLAGGWRSAPDADVIGRDIMPCAASTTVGRDDKFNKDTVELAREQNARAAKAMEGVSLGLGEAINL